MLPIKKIKKNHYIHAKENNGKTKRAIDLKMSSIMHSTTSHVAIVLKLFTLFKFHVSYRLENGSIVARIYSPIMWYYICV